MFSKSAFLKLVDIELNSGQSAERLDITMCEPIKLSHILSSMFPGQHVTCSAAIESRGQQFARNQIVQLNKDCAVKILRGILVAGKYYLLVHQLQKSSDRCRNSPIAHWHPKVDAVACIQLEKNAIYGLPMFHRTNDNGSISFIEWAKIACCGKKKKGSLPELKFLPISNTKAYEELRNLQWTYEQLISP